MKKMSLSGIALALMSFVSNAQTTEAELSKIILQQDSIFWAAFNRCDIEGMGAFFSKNVEFYHDKGGPMLSFDQVMTQTKNGLCGNNDYKTRREAVPGTIQLFPMQKNDTIYGAILRGDHFFYVTEKGKKEYRSGRARFTHLWLKEDGVWKMHRILSFDHQPAEYVNARKEINLPDNELKQYIGKYKGPNVGEATVSAGKGVLVMTIGKNKYTIYPQNNSIFFSKERDLTFEFLKENNKVTGIRVRERDALAEELQIVK